MLQFPVCHWAGGVASPYFGGTNWLHRGPLDGVVNGASATMSFHVHFPGNGDAVIGLSTSTNFGLSKVSFSGGNLFVFFSRAAVADGAYEIRSTGVNLVEEAWHQVLLSFSGTTAHLWIDGVNRLGSTALHGDPLDFTSDQFAVGAQSVAGGSSLDGCLQDLHVEFNKFVDFSVEANRDLYARGVLAAGTADVFLSGDPTAFETNQGSGGAFTRAGPAFTDCSNRVDS